MDVLAGQQSALTDSIGRAPSPQRARAALESPAPVRGRILVDFNDPDRVVVEAMLDPPGLDERVSRVSDHAEPRTPGRLRLPSVAHIGQMPNRVP
jgi:hypothetical protein